MGNSGQDANLSSLIFKFLQCDSLAEAGAVLDEALAGNAGAQYITARALIQAGKAASAEWMSESAAQGFTPALISVKRKLKQRSGRRNSSTAS